MLGLQFYKNYYLMHTMFQSIYFISKIQFKIFLFLQVEQFEKIKNGAEKRPSDLNEFSFEKSMKELVA